MSHKGCLTFHLSEGNDINIKRHHELSSSVDSNANEIYFLGNSGHESREVFTGSCLWMSLKC